MVDVESIIATVRKNVDEGLDIVADAVERFHLTKAELEKRRASMAALAQSMGRPVYAREAAAYDQAIAAIEAEPAARAARLEALLNEMEHLPELIEELKADDPIEWAEIIKRAETMLRASPKAPAAASPRKGPKKSRWQVLPPPGEGECDYNPELDPAFEDEPLWETNRRAFDWQVYEAKRLAKESALFRHGTRPQDITKDRLGKVSQAIKAWKETFLRLKRARRGVTKLGENDRFRDAGGRPPDNGIAMTTAERSRVYRQRKRASSTSTAVMAARNQGGRHGQKT